MERYGAITLHFGTIWVVVWFVSLLYEFDGM